MTARRRTTSGGTPAFKSVNGETITNIPLIFSAENDENGQPIPSAKFGFTEEGHLYIDAMSPHDLLIGESGLIRIDSQGRLHLSDATIEGTNLNSLYQVTSDTPYVPTKLGTFWINPSTGEAKICTESGTPANDPDPEVPATWVTLSVAT